jgi:HEAT repeat protein
VHSISELLDSIAKAGLIAQVLAASLSAVVFFLGLILIRRGVRRSYYLQRDRHVIEIRRHWKEIIEGKISAKAWMLDRVSRDIVEGIILDRLQVAPANETAQLIDCLRMSGLLDARIHEARHWEGWRRQLALLAVGRMRVPEAIPALAEALDDPDEENRTVAVRGLGELGMPRAAVPILQRLSAGELQVSTNIVQDALINNCRSTPALAMSFLLKAVDSSRPILTRVLGEIASPDLDEDLLLLAADEEPEVRASAARALAASKPGLALSILAGLMRDDEWFVRLRAVVALGDLNDPRSIPSLLEGLCDPNRQVRMRSAHSLARLKGHEEEILCLAIKSQDAYAVEALISEFERSGGVFEMVSALADSKRCAMAESAILAALKAGSRRILIDLVLHHENWRTRGRLARLLARSGDSSLLGMIEMFDSPNIPLRKRRVLNWLRKKIGTETLDTSYATKVVA